MNTLLVHIMHIVQILFEIFENIIKCRKYKKKLSRYILNLLIIFYTFLYSIN